MQVPDLTYRPLTMANWPDFESLFGARGACGGCWCMAWRLPRSAFNQGKGDANRSAMRALVEQGQKPGSNPPGILLYRDGLPIGWCSVAPRVEFVFLSRSRVWGPVDDNPVWSISCFFVAKDHRNQGMSVELLKAAVEFARSRGARIVEGYPQEVEGGPLPAPFVWTGLASAYLKAGFHAALRRSAKKPIMRYEIAPG
jgi:GNAT superfamily N-acetyltransferase